MSPLSGQTMNNQVLTILRPDFSTTVSRPVFVAQLAAGRPAADDDDAEGSLDLNEHLVRDRFATFFLKVHGNSLMGIGICDGDLLVVDRMMDANDKSIVVAMTHGQFTVKELKKEHGRAWLMPENDMYQPVEMTMQAQAAIWGVVTNVIRQLV
jgi:DNA polymerase V